MNEKPSLTEDEKLKFAACIYYKLNSSLLKWTVITSLVTIFLSALLLVVLVLMFNNTINAVRCIEQEEAKILAAINNHKEISLQNRAVQESIKAILQTYMAQESTPKSDLDRASKRGK